MADLFESSIMNLIDNRASKLENELNADVIFYHGPILSYCFQHFRDFVEEVSEKSKKNRNVSGQSERNSLALILRTGGGSAEITERMVDVIRYHYQKVYFVVPEMAMSAGTILCMSGDKIYMDYSSSLGPIDPQVQLPDTGELVPALGYIDKVSEIENKDNLSQYDVIMLKTIDLAKLALFEQAKDLSIDLLKDWLVKYKFKDWTVHRTDTNKRGNQVTYEEKVERAEQIATDLANHKKWRSHGRSLDINKLKELRIEIDDYSDNENLRKCIREYNDPLTGYIDRTKQQFYMHSPWIS